LQRGVARGAFRSDLDPWRAASTLMAQIKGLGIQALGRTDSAQTDALVDDLPAQVERALGA
ncbi:MAG: TetR family transcriptional regulator, partial [Chloroflexota bacterium]